VPIVLKSGSLNLLEPSGPVQACNGIALPLPVPFFTYQWWRTSQGNLFTYGRKIRLCTFEQCSTMPYQTNN